MGLQLPDASTAARADAITIMYALGHAYQADHGRDPLTSALAAAARESTAELPDRPAAVRLRAGRDLAVFDAAGAFDLFSVTASWPTWPHFAPIGRTASSRLRGGRVRDAGRDAHLLVRRRGPPASSLRRVPDRRARRGQRRRRAVRLLWRSQPAVVAQARAGNRQLLVRCGRRSAAAAGAARRGRVLRPLPLSLFSDGPWCGEGDNRFDADLLRVRTVRVAVRVQAAHAGLRGIGADFAVPGTSRSARRALPDYAVTFDVTPRNLNLGGEMRMHLTSSRAGTAATRGPPLSSRSLRRCCSGRLAAGLVSVTNTEVAIAANYRDASETRSTPPTRSRNIWSVSCSGAANWSDLAERRGLPCLHRRHA